MKCNKNKIWFIVTLFLNSLWDLLLQYASGHNFTLMRFYFLLLTLLVLSCKNDELTKQIDYKSKIKEVQYFRAKKLKEKFVYDEHDSLILKIEYQDKYELVHFYKEEKLDSIVGDTIYSFINRKLFSKGKAKFIDDNGFYGISGWSISKNEPTFYLLNQLRRDGLSFPSQFITLKDLQNGYYGFDNERSSYFLSFEDEKNPEITILLYYSPDNKLFNKKYDEKKSVIKFYHSQDSLNYSISIDDGYNFFDTNEMEEGLKKSKFVVLETTYYLKGKRITSVIIDYKSNPKAMSVALVEAGLGQGEGQSIKKIWE